MKNTEKTMEKIVALCKGRGFIFAGSEIYGGLANTWDYGPLGVELKNNVKRAWWKKFVQENPYNVGLDAAILMNPQVWVASGHVGGFSDPLMDCKECKERFRADKVIEDWCQENGFALEKPVDAMSQGEMKDFVEEHNIPCPTCGKHNWTDIRQFNLMFKTFQGGHRGRQEHRVPAAGDRPGHLRQLPERPADHPAEAALRRVPGGQELPQRDHPRQLHLPYP